MRITKYGVEINTDGNNILVKESSCNYTMENALDNCDKIAKVMKEVFKLDKKAEEYVYMIALNTTLKPIGFFEVSHGAVNQSIMSPSEIFIRALLVGASNIILVHNHPSGDTTPSQSDIRTTKRMKDCANLMNISLLDHIIIGDDIYSFLREGSL